MSAGPHVFGDGRVGLWVQSNSNLKDKLIHFLPRLRGAVPNLTDIFLPTEATIDHRRQVLGAEFFCHKYTVNHSLAPIALADKAIAAHHGGAMELNIEGLSENILEQYVRDAVKRVRAKKPNLPLRINVVPFKAQWLPKDLFHSDSQLFVIAQSYGGNMEILYAADEVKRDLTAWGIPEEKVSVQHAIMCTTNPNAPRQVTLPVIRGRGSLYIDDLLQDAGLL